MIQNFDFHLKTRFVFNEHAEQNVGAVLAHDGLRHALIHYDGGAYVTESGLLQAVQTSLEKQGMAVSLLGGVQPNPRFELVQEGIQLCKEQGCDVVVAIGGGSAIDSSKAIALGAPYEGNVWDFFTAKTEPTQTLPVAAVVTCPAAGSESSQVVVINNEQTHEKLFVSHPVVRPAYAFMNPQLTLSLPAYPTACGMVDMLCHLSERYFNETSTFGINDYLLEAAMSFVVDHAQKLLSQRDDYDLRSEFMWVATIAQNNMLGVGRSQDWATHAISNEISAHFDVAHGATISIVLPAWMRYVAASNPVRFKRFARTVMKIDAPEEELAEQAIQKLISLFKSLLLPVSLGEVGITQKDLDLLVSTIAFEAPTQTVGAVMQLNAHDCKCLLRDAL